LRGWACCLRPWWLWNACGCDGLEVRGMVPRPPVGALHLPGAWHLRSRPPAPRHPCPRTRLALPSVPCTSQVRGTFAPLLLRPPAPPPPDIPTFPKWYPKSPPLTFPANCGILCPMTSARRAPSRRTLTTYRRPRRRNEHLSKLNPFMSSLLPTPVLPVAPVVPVVSGAEPSRAEPSAVEGSQRSNVPTFQPAGIRTLVPQKKVPGNKYNNIDAPPTYPLQIAPK